MKVNKEESTTSRMCKNQLKKKNKNTTSTPLLLSFKRKEPLKFIKVPGEQAKLKVMIIMKDQLSCKTCARYEHTVKICHETRVTCAKCSNRGHSKDKCTGAEVSCSHWGAVQQAFSRSCPLLKQELEIIQIQTKERLLRLQAVRKLFRLNPNSDLFFANAVKNTSNPTTPKLPTRFEQGRQSNSIDEANVTQFFSKTSGMKKTTHRLYRPTSTDTMLREKKKEREPALPTATCRWRGSEKSKEVKDQRM